MTHFDIPVLEFKKFEDPFKDQIPEERVKYRFFVDTKEVPKELEQWMQTNPREQKLTTAVAKSIENSLISNNRSFHLLNRGILLSVDSIKYNNKDKMASMVLTDPSKHGNIDGGHTFKTIIGNQPELVKGAQFVEFEVITGLSSADELAEARNTSIQVDSKSIHELKGSFDVLKEILKDESYFDRITFKQNQYFYDQTPNLIDVREIIAIINMFNPIIYPHNRKSPISSYTGKETSLNKFIKLGDRTTRNNMLQCMRHILPETFSVWDAIEKDFIDVTKKLNKRYGTKKYSDTKGKECFTLFSNVKLEYVIPRGLLYPMVSAFRALVELDDSGEYKWVCDPIKAWKDNQDKIVATILGASEEQGNNPNAVGKSENTWASLFMIMQLYSYQSKLGV